MSQLGFLICTAADIGRAAAKLSSKTVPHIKVVPRSQNRRMHDERRAVVYTRCEFWNRKAIRLP